MLTYWLNVAALLPFLFTKSGSTVTCIATDDSKKGALAVAGGEGQLLVYLPSQKNISK